MKKPILILITFSVWLVLSFPCTSFAEDTKNKTNYFAVKAGMYLPRDNESDADFNDGFNGELAFGHYFTPYFAIEGGIGYFETDISARGNNFSLGFFDADHEVSVIPITATIKGVYPFVNGEYYIGLGVGAYYEDFDGKWDTTNFGRISLDDEDTVVGFHFMTGVLFNISKNTFLGAEWKIIWTDDAEFEDTFSGGRIGVELDLDSNILTANLGYRF